MGRFASANISKIYFIPIYLAKSGTTYIDGNKQNDQKEKRNSLNCFHPVHETVLQPGHLKLIPRGRVNQNR